MIDLLVRENLDHVLGCRVDDKDNSAYRFGHAQGNKMFNSPGRLPLWRHSYRHALRLPCFSLAVS